MEEQNNIIVFIFKKYDTFTKKFNSKITYYNFVDFHHLDLAYQHILILINN